jgi:hypothetical protein
MHSNDTDGVVAKGQKYREWNSKTTKILIQQLSRISDVH